MTEATRALTAQCAHCGVEFEPRKSGHIFHSVRCRHLGYRHPHERTPIDEEQVARLFDEDRDPDERVRPDDWFAGPAGWAELYACDTVAGRRRWYRNLERMGGM